MASSRAGLSHLVRSTWSVSALKARQSPLWVKQLTAGSPASGAPPDPRDWGAGKLFWQPASQRGVCEIPVPKADSEPVLLLVSRLCKSTGIAGDQSLTQVMTAPLLVELVIELAGSPRERPPLGSPLAG